MAKATYVQRGEALDYKNSTTTAIKAGDVVKLESRIGIAGDDIAVGDIGAVHVTGVFRIAKTREKEIAMGKLVYFDGTGITDTAESNTAAGYAAETALAADTTILVKLLG